RLYHSIELSLIILVAAVVDVVLGDLTGTRVLLLVLVPASLLAVAGHFLAIVTSSRLRAGTAPAATR
ncbi:MAG: CDP-alcohol phosphatidyltransferase, partial [Modestobacter sp.]|nr:CDP-alcohol phosphatidyltransferase [Modestobacter sp.]